MTNNKHILLDALRLLGESNDIIQDTHGNVSLRDDFGNIYIKPSGMDYSSIRLTDICQIDINNKQVLIGGRNRKPSVDLIHHAAIYENRSNIKAICHTHSPYATAYAYNMKSIKCYSTEQSDFFGEDIFCHPYSDLNNWGESVSQYLHKTAKAALLHRHGVLTFGKTPEEAVKLAIAVENCARKNYLAETLFNNDTRMSLEPLNKLEIAKWHHRYNNNYGQ